MTVFNRILSEAIQNEKQFESSDDLIKKVKYILRKSSVASYKETKASDSGFKTPHRLGYKFAALNGNITISFVGNEKSWINEIIRELGKNKVNYSFNSAHEIILIKSEDNIKGESILSPEARKELENGEFGIIGITVHQKKDIKDAVEHLAYLEKEIYNELIKGNFITWKQVKLAPGKIAYTLTKTILTESKIEYKEVFLTNFDEAEIYKLKQIFSTAIKKIPYVCYWNRKGTNYRIFVEELDKFLQLWDLRLHLHNSMSLVADKIINM
jgi:hypothetical protein